MEGLGKSPKKGKKSLKQLRKGKHCKHGFRKGSAKCRKTAKRRPAKKAHRKSKR